MSDPKENQPPAVSQYWLERLALGEVSDKERARLEAQAAAAGQDLDALLAELRTSDQAVLDDYPAEMMAARIDKRLGERQAERDRVLAGPPSTGKGWLGGLGLAVAAAAALLIFANLPQGPVDSESGARTGGEAVRLKGAQPALVVWRKSQGAAERLEDGAQAAAGDVLQLEYNAAGTRYGVIASVDGRGTVTLHYPADAQESTQLKTGATPLDFGYQLDDAPDFERFFFVTSKKPLDPGEITSALSALAETHRAHRGRLALPEQAQYTDFTVEKK